MPYSYGWSADSAAVIVFHGTQRPEWHHAHDGSVPTQRGFIPHQQPTAPPPHHGRLPLDLEREPGDRPEWDTFGGLDCDD